MIPNFPNTTTLTSRLGTKPQMIEKVLDYCKANEGFDDIVEICLSLSGSLKSSKEPNESTSDANA